MEIEIANKLPIKKVVEGFIEITGYRRKCNASGALKLMSPNLLQALKLRGIMIFLNVHCQPESGGCR